MNPEPVSVGDWSSVFPSMVDSAKDSCKLVKKLLAIAVLNIPYIRFSPSLA